MCTVHSFPHNIDHCLTFARSEFEGLLEKSPSEANAFLSDPAKYLTSVRQVSFIFLLRFPYPLCSTVSRVPARKHIAVDSHLLLSRCMDRSWSQRIAHHWHNISSHHAGISLQTGVWRIVRDCGVLVLCGSQVTARRGSSWRRWWRCWTPSAARPLRTASPGRGAGSRCDLYPEGL